VTDLCIRCGAAPATPVEWPHCEPCYQIVCDEVHQAICELREQDDAVRKAVPADLLLRLVRGRVPSLTLWCNGIYRGDCPWCDEEGELCSSFFVYPANYYHCFACEAHGDAIQFLMIDEGIGFIAATEWLAREHGLR
jgi:hypothetical protein